jgi:hypothetical protein
VVLTREMTLRGRKLKKKLKKGAQVHDLNLMDCYSAYRATLRKLKPRKVARIASKDEALFYAETKGVRVFERLAKTLSKKTISRLRKKFSDYLFQHYKVDWDRLLPKNSLPPKFDAEDLRCPTKFRFHKKKQKRALKPDCE